LSGDVIVGENTLIGQNVTIYMKIKIGKNVIIKNGSNVFHNIKDNEVVEGNR
jgi:acetyltransferase-like isoleucine patch superfamily enzyme